MPGRSLALPLLLGLAALLASQAFQTVQLLRQRDAIHAAAAAQAQATEAGDRVRKHLDIMLAGATALARSGNQVAAGAMAELARQGLVYTPPP